MLFLLNEVGGRASEFLCWCQLQCASGGMTGKLTFGKGTRVSIISGESSQMAPLATHGPVPLILAPGNLVMTMVRPIVGVLTDCLTEAFMKEEGIIINL